MKFFLIFAIINLCLIYVICEQKFYPKNIYRALSQNGGLFDFGFSTTYVAVEPFEFEHFLFIRKDFWKVLQKKTNEKEVCIEELESQVHSEFDMKFQLGFSYLSEHMVQHDDELNLTNHVLLQMSMRSSEYLAEFESHEIIENIFDANHDNLHYMVGGDYYVFPIPHFNATVAFQPQSFTDDEDTDGPNFVFVQQNMTDSGYERQMEVHSIINETVFRNTSDRFSKYIPEFIAKVDPQLYINAILPMRLGGDQDVGRPAAILIVYHESIIKYCVTLETEVDKSCKPENLKQLLGCHIRDEL